MNILEAIQSAAPGSMVTISSPCTENGCRQSESSWPVEEVRKALGYITAKVTTTNGEEYEYQVPPVPSNTVCIPTVWTEELQETKRCLSGNSLFDRTGKILG